MPQSKVDNWKSKKRHKVTLNTGTEVTIEIPNLPEFLREGTVPNHLVKFAVEQAETLADPTQEFDPEKIKEATDFQRWVVSITVKDPELKPEDVPGLPAEDVDMITEFAMRGRDTDAIGHQLSGLERLPEWRRFRRGE